MYPIRRGVPGNKHVIVETEVFHEKCVRAGQVGTSRTRSLEAELARLREALTQQRIQASRAHAELEEKLHNANRKRSDLEYIAERARTDQERSASDLRAVRSALEDVRHNMVVLVQERDAARQEAALHQTIQRSTAVAQPIAQVAVPLENKTAVPTPPTDDRDDTQIRFGLLELT